MMKVALGQFAVRPEWQRNADTCLELMAQAGRERADLLVLPEGVLARDITDPDLVRRSAQPLDGPFVTRLLQASRSAPLTGLRVMMCVHVAAANDKVFNLLIALRDGQILAQYRKLHLYDAFSAQESANVMPGYDLRFPELARRLALDGAEVLVLPAAWVKGPLKEAHWELLLSARALENTCYAVAAGECGERNIGHSMVVDPLGVVVARAAESPALLIAALDPARIAHARRVLPVLANRRFARPELEPGR